MGLFIKRVGSLIFLAEKQEKSGIFFFFFQKIVIYLYHKSKKLLNYTIMKLRNLFGLLLAMTLFVVGCTKTEVDNKPSKLNITSEYPMEFSSRGGEGVITFTLDNPVADAKVTATCEAAWIKYLTVAEGENKVTFYVERNTVEEGRETTIYVNYLDTPYTVKVKQLAKDITVMSYESANRIPSAMYNLPNNNIITKFQVQDGDYIYALCLTFIVPEGENTLVEGTYSVADGTLNNDPELCQMMQVNVAGNEPELVDKYVFVDGSAEIWVTDDSYRIWASLYDADGERYSYSYKGQITGIVPAEPTTVNATFCQGFAYEAEGGLYEYELFLSDMDFLDNGTAQAGGNYFKFVLYGEPGVVNGNLVTIPAGSYASVEDVEEGYVFAAGEINLSNCFYTNGPYNVDMMSISAAFLEVTETGVSARVVAFADSESFYEFVVNFEGAPTVEAPEGVEPGPGPEPGPGEGVVFEALDCSGVCYGFEYGTTFNYYLFLSDAGFDEDGYALAGGTYYQLDLYSVEGELDGEGNIIVAPGTYVLDPANNMDEWSICAAYSRYFVVNADGTDYEVPKTEFAEATLVVTATNATLTAVIEGVQHEVTYNGQLKLPAPAVVEPGETVEVDVPYAYAFYFGDMYNPGYADNYYLFLSDLGLDEDGYELPNGTYYRFDLYAPITDSNLTKLPAGTYTIDMYDSCEPWTASLSYSGYYVMDDYGWDYVVLDYPGSGTIVVNEDGSVVAEVTMLSSGETHKVTYSAGAITVYDGRTGGGESDDTYSTLTSDLVCNLSDHTLYYENYGDWYEVGYQNWMVSIMPNSEEGDFVMFDLLAAANHTEDFFGTYTISDSLAQGTSVVGYIDYGYLAGSWYYTHDGVTMAPFVSGWVEILDNGDGTASVEFEVWDDVGYFVEGACTCRLAPASELQSVTRSNAKFNSQVYAPKAETKVVEKSRIVAKNAQKSAAAVKGISLRK